MTAAKLTIPCPHVPGVTAPVACAECIAAYAAQVREEAGEERAYLAAAAIRLADATEALLARMEDPEAQYGSAYIAALKAHIYAARARAAKEPKP